MYDNAMLAAINSAQEGVTNREGGPFGACIVREQEIISVAHNTVLASNDPTCHAEINAIRKACQKLQTHILSSCEIYTTSEPCPMCLAAIYWARLKKIHIGVTRDVAARFGFDDALFYHELLAKPEERAIPSTLGVRARECEHLFALWKNNLGDLY